MAVAGQCSSCYYTSPTLQLQLQLHRRHGHLPQQPQAARRARWPRLQVAAAAGGGSIKAATDAEFFQPSDTRPIMLFDGVCNLCNGGVRFVREHDPNRSIRYIPLQSESGRKLLQRSGRSPDDISSVVLVEKDRSFIKSEAVLRIMEYLNLPFPQLAIFLNFIPLFLRDFAYDNVANNRYAMFGRSETEAWLSAGAVMETPSMSAWLHWNKVMCLSALFFSRIFLTHRSLHKEKASN